MSRITKLAAVTLAAVTMVAGASFAQAETRILRYADFGPDRGTRAEVIKWLDSEMRARSDGALGLDITWGGTLLGAKNAIDGVGNGVSDLASVVPVYEPGKLTAWRVSDVRQISDEYVGMMATYELMTQNDAAMKNFADQGVHYISNFTTGPTQLLSREPITNLDELKGKKIRATGSFGKAFEAEGAAAVSMSQPDVYQALSTGTIDGTASYAYVINSYKQYEVAKHLTTIDMGQNLGWGIVMNSRVWSSLSPEHQSMMTTLGHDATLYMAQKMYEDRTEILSKLRAGVDGNTIVEHEGDPAMRKALIEAAESAGMDWMGGAKDQGLPADDLLTAFDSAVAKYHKEMEVQGYPWAKK
ncbi:MAG: TRAP transporter substrate-binding protein DctP [Alphaproteobacteria bacterium]|nr:TRAP transporter substrate-binding protein DctP [Alphaproteobacteria bacterium]